MVPSNFMINSCMWYNCNINNHYFRSHGFHSGASCSVQVSCVTLCCSQQSVYSSNPRCQPQMQEYLLHIVWQLIVLVSNICCFVTYTLTRKDWLQFGSVARVPNKKQNVQNPSLPCLPWSAKLGASV
jgi:hypothetical protein